MLKKKRNYIIEDSDNWDRAIYIENPKEWWGFFKEQPFIIDVYTSPTQVFLNFNRLYNADEVNDEIVRLLDAEFEKKTSPAPYVIERKDNLICLYVSNSDEWYNKLKSQDFVAGIYTEDRSLLKDYSFDNDEIVIRVSKRYDPANVEMLNKEKEYVQLPLPGWEVE